MLTKREPSEQLGANPQLCTERKLTDMKVCLTELSPRWTVRAKKNPDVKLTENSLPIESISTWAEPLSWELWGAASTRDSSVGLK